MPALGTYVSAMLQQQQKQYEKVMRLTIHTDDLLQEAGHVEIEPLVEDALQAARHLKASLGMLGFQLAIDKACFVASSLELEEAFLA